MSKKGNFVELDGDEELFNMCMNVLKKDGSKVKVVKDNKGNEIVRIKPSKKFIEKTGIGGNEP